MPNPRPTKIGTLNLQNFFLFEVISSHTLTILTTILFEPLTTIFFYFQVHLKMLSLIMFFFAIIIAITIQSYIIIIVIFSLCFQLLFKYRPSSSNTVVV